MVQVGPQVAFEPGVHAGERGQHAVLFFFKSKEIFQKGVFATGVHVFATTGGARLVQGR